MDFRQLATETLAELEAKIEKQAKWIHTQAAEIKRCHTLIDQLQANALLAGSLAAQRTALINELIARLPEDTQEIV